MGLKEEYLRRVTELAELRQLQNFSKKHPGLQHKAGVTMGGTFIIVYHHPTRKKRVIAEKDVFAENKRIKKEIKHVSKKDSFLKENSEEIERLVEILEHKKITVLEFIRFAEKIGEEPEDLIEILKEIDARLLKNIKGLREEDIYDRDEDKDDAIAEASENLSEGIVIADFYLPYLCYSNCPPVTYQVGEIKDIPVNVRLALQPNARTNSNAYSVEDDSSYDFTYSPEGGTLSNATPENGVEKEGDKHIFIPYNLQKLMGANEKVDLSFSYSAQGNTSNTVNVTVYNVPTAEIVLNPSQMPQAAGSKISITSKVQFADKYTWFIDGVQVSTDKDLGERTFDESKTYVISLSVEQSVTGASVSATDVEIIIAGKPTVEITAKVAEELPTIKTGINTTDFKFNVVKTTSPFTIEAAEEETIIIPLGGKIDFTSKSENAVDFAWMINNEKVSTGEHMPGFVFKKAVTHLVKQIVASVTGEKAESNTITVIVEPKPTALIITNPQKLPTSIAVNTGIVFNSQTENADQWSWVIRSVEKGLVIKESDNEHLGNFIFGTEGNYTIELTAINTTTNQRTKAPVLEIEVIAGPKAKIISSPIVSTQPIPTGTTITFTGEVENADEFAWSFRNAAGATLKTGSAKDFGAITFTDPGTFLIGLEVGNSITKATERATDVIVNVQAPQKEPFIIRLDPGTTQTSFPNPSTLSFTTVYTGTNSFRWMIDGVQITSTTSRNLTNRLFNESRSYKIQAQAIFGGNVIDTSNELIINIQKTQTPTDPPKDPTTPSKNACGSLSEIIGNFRNIIEIDSKNFQQFNSVILEELGISDYFKQMEERLTTDDPDIQLDFFENEIYRGALIDKNLEGWLFALQNILLDEKRKNLHLLASVLYNILFRLAMYISCIHRQDIGQVPLNMANVFRIIREHIEAFLLNTGIMATDAADQIKNFKELINKELAKMDANGIDKPFYRSLLNEMLELF
jgi:hypothetical protein